MDNRCLPRDVAGRLGAPLGDECRAFDGAEYGCAEGFICRMGHCQPGGAGEDGGGDRAGDAGTGERGADGQDGGETPAGDGADAADAPDGAGEGAAGMCTEGTASDGAPLFGGVMTAVSDGPDAVVLGWIAAADETPPADIAYLVFRATAPGTEDLAAPVATVVGKTSYRMTGLTSGTKYHFIVRARDAIGQTECNTKEMSATPAPLPDCIDYTNDVQTIFTANCIKCHSGPTAPRNLHLDSYAGVIAGGLTGSEVVACQPDSSLLYLKISLDKPPVGARMPFGGPYLATAQIATIRKWIGQGASATCPVDAGRCSDGTPPTFAGLKTATLAPSATGAQLCWDAASDGVTPASELLYDVYEATAPGGEKFTSPPRTTSPAGATCIDIAGLTPGQEFCWVVRARDAAGNRDSNMVEKCLTPPVATCADFATVVQPIFTANCVRCHSGPTAPRNLHLDSYAGVIAGGLTGSEVVACQPDSSLLYLKISQDVPPVGARMPFGGPYLAPAQIAAIRQWITEGAAAACPIDPTRCSDGTPPTFAGAKTATTAASGTGAQLCWDAASDDVTPAGDLLYDVYEATAPAGEKFTSPPRTTTPGGATCVDLTGLTPGQKFCWVVRARDAAGNRDTNTVEQCLTMPAATCADYETAIQPIFTANCIRCHSGPTAPRNLHLDSYAGVIAGGLTGSEVVACQPDTSLLYLKISLDKPPVGARMPFGGPYLAPAQIAAIRQWIAEGAAAMCPVDPARCSDGTPPTFAGLKTATLAAGGTGAQLCWDAASDGVTPVADLLYDVYEATAPGGEAFASPPRTTSAAGATCVDVTGLTPGQEFCWVVRSRDAAGNRDTNTVERCLTPPAASCADFTTVIQPIFTANCIRCHSGPTAPRNLHLDSYAGVIAGGLTGSEVVACQPDSSLLYLKISQDMPPVGARMPFGGPYLAPAQIAAIRQWISEGAAAMCPIDPGLCSDTMAPTFAGLNMATLAASGTGAQLCWDPAIDDVTLASELFYDVYEATAPGGEKFASPPRTTSPGGAACVDLAGLTPGQEFCWVVRARDAAGNRDTNTVEKCLTMPAASCADYATVIQPIFTANCTRCHSGPTAPRNLHLDSYAGVLAGGLTGAEVVACRSADSLLWKKISMSTPPVGVRMPFDGPPYLPQAQIDAIAQWIDEGARSSCASPGPCGDAMAPTFAGLTMATATGPTTAELCWAAATDDVTPSSAIVYDVYQADAAGGEAFTAPPRLTGSPGATCVTVDALSPTLPVCFVVRARDAAGNRDGNTVERCLTMPAVPAGCVDYATLIQPLLDRNCTRCHSGSFPPQWLRLGDYNGIMAGGVRRSEVRACDALGSLILGKISPTPPFGRRMPWDGPPYLTDPQIALVRQWIENGTQRACAEAASCSDTTAPTFAGTTSATAVNETTIRVCWTEGSDAATPTESLRYAVFESTTPGGESYASPPQEMVVGVSCTDVRVGPGTNMCFVVRAQDRRGNRDGNTVEVCATTAASMCAVGFAALVQPVLAARCTHCHRGPEAPRFLDLTSYAGLLASGSLRSEVRACDWTGSFVRQKTAGAACGRRMPWDGPPYLAPSETSLLKTWVDSGARQSCADADPCGDATPPVFAGAESAVVIDSTTARICWSPASDATVPAGAITYDVYEAAAPGGEALAAPASYAAPAGSTCLDVPVPSGSTTCFVVRARDTRRNRDGNTVERCVTTPAGCIDYSGRIQPLFNSRCVHCHSGPSAPKDIRWDTYAHAIAAPDEVRSCDPDGSKLNRAVEECRMPRDTMDDMCTTTACLTPSQQRLLRQWVGQGAAASCPNGGCP